MIAYIILIVVVGVLLLGVGGTMLLRPRGMHGVRRGRARELDLTGPMPKASDQSSSGTGTATATAPPPTIERPAEPTAPPRPTLEKYKYPMPGEEAIRKGELHVGSREAKALLRVKPKWRSSGAAIRPRAAQQPR